MRTGKEPVAKDWYIMNVVLVADTHGTVADNIVDVAQRADLVVHAGDIGCAAVLDLLRPARGK
jgi:predicted phosphodiesterase